MKKVLFLAVLLLTSVAIGIAQEETTEEKKVEKKIMVKIVEEDGKVVSKVIEVDDDVIEGDKIWMTEKGDSIEIKVEVDEEGGNIIKKKIIIPGMEDIDIDIDLEGLEKEIEILKLDDHFQGQQPHMYYFDRGNYPHPEVFTIDEFMFKHQGEPKAKLGVYIEEAKKGVKVTKVIENSSAYSVGILAGDVITHIDGKKMTNVEELQRAVSDHKPGDMINIKLKRNGKSKKFTARLQGENAAPNVWHHEFPKDLGPKFKEKMKKLEHHLYRGIDECHKSKEEKKECHKHQKKEMKQKKMELKKKMEFEKQKEMQEKKLEEKELKLEEH